MTRFCKEKGITSLIMGMLELGFANDSFDVAYALNSFLHLPKK